ncbi:MAG: HNH endonuclease [Actinomycetia bacterium]|nr:HNH endonuclease [Actinomycetes bacterium]
MDAIASIKEIEDYLFPKMKLDPWERCLYYHLLRHTRFRQKETSLFGILSLARSSGMSEAKVRDSVRSLNEKGCISIESRSRAGHILKVFLPKEMSGLIPVKEDTEKVDIETIDFFKDRKYLHSLLDREQNRCFYCFRAISETNCELDHVDPQSNRKDHSYRNIVASCHECNTTKQDKSGADFIRSLYRKGLLSQDELENRLNELEQLKAGNLIPEIKT